MIDTILPNTKLYIKKISDKKGWGVYASEEIKKGEIVEICYCFILHDDRREFVDYAFSVERSSTNLLPWGYGCIYNHSDIPNLHYVLDLHNKLIKFIAIKDIGIDEELCHHYGEGYLKRKPLI
jgi:SET domain-containing protein